MRLIDADALMDVIRQHAYLLATKQGSIGYGMFMLGIQQAVDGQPTIDAIPIVRCRDCKHRGTNECIFHIKGEPADEELLKKLDNDFCSYGERRNS